MMAEGIVEDVVGDHHSVKDNCSNRDEKEDGDFEDSSSFCPPHQGIGESSVAIGDGTTYKDPSNVDPKSSTSALLLKVKVKDWFTQTDINRNRINGTDVTTQAGHNREKLHEALLAYCQDTHSQTELELLTKITQDAAIQKESEVAEVCTQKSTEITNTHTQKDFNYAGNYEKEGEDSNQSHNEMAIQHDYSYFGVDVAIQNGPGVNIPIQKEIGIETVPNSVQVQTDQETKGTQKHCETSAPAFENVASQTEKARRQFTQDMLTQYEELELDSSTFPMSMTYERDGVKLTVEKQASNDITDMMTQYEYEYEYESLPTTSRLTQLEFLDKDEEDTETDRFIHPGKIRDSLVTKQMKNSMANTLREQIENLSLSSYSSSHHDSEIQRLLNPDGDGTMLKNDDDQEFPSSVKLMENYELDKEEEERVIRNNFVQVYKPTIRKAKKSRKFCIIS